MTARPLSPSRITQDLADAKLFGKPEPVNECLVFGDIVGGGKMDLQHIFELVAFRRGEYDAGSQASAHLGAVEIHPPNGWNQALEVGTGSWPS